MVNISCGVSCRFKEEGSVFLADLHLDCGKTGEMRADVDRIAGRRWQSQKVGKVATHETEQTLCLELNTYTPQVSNTRLISHLHTPRQRLNFHPRNCPVLQAAPYTITLGVNAVHEPNTQQTHAAQRNERSSSTQERHHAAV
jgi:hypothetical protein